MAIKKDIKENSSPVYFASIEVENVFCFKTLQKLDLCDENGFPAQWTVILGDNGVGKTTLLRCLAAMEPVIIHTPEDKIPTVAPRSSSGINDWNERSTRHLLRANITANYICGCLISDDSKLVANNQENSEEKKIALGHEFDGEYYDRITVNYSRQLLGLKCYGYGANRRTGKTSLSDTLSSHNTSSLFSDDNTLINAEEWLLQADYAIARSDSDTNVFKKNFDVIQETLKQLLPDITDIRISPAGKNRSRPTAEFLTPYGWVSISNLGLGYRTVTAWMVDLSAKMIDSYPNSENPLTEPAVVLVDEIDLHLHPKWQRTIMSILTERFPNVQFIVTAHSPLVVQAARNANLVLLRREGDHVVIDNNPEVIENWRVEQVLTSIFELPSTLPADIEPLVQRRRAILAKSTLTKKDKQELKGLEAKIGNLPSAESAADIQAMDIIRKAAKLLENR
jgi:predicted ATP-binding protein involved in virulence